MSTNTTDTTSTLAAIAEDFPVGKAPDDVDAAKAAIEAMAQSPTTGIILDSEPAAPKISHVLAGKLALVVNGNLDPRTFTEAEREAVLAFLRNAAEALA